MTGKGEVSGNVVVVKVWCFVVEAGRAEMGVWRRRCWRGVLAVLCGRGALQTDGESVHIQRLKFKDIKTLVLTYTSLISSDRNKRGRLILRTKIESIMEQQKQLQSLTNEYQSLQNGTPRDRERKPMSRTILIFIQI